VIKKGLYAALASAIFLGMAPVLGKQAILLGIPPLGVVAVRTALAAFLLLLAIVIFKRSYLYIYPAGLLGCLLAGSINGIGSLFYYASLARIDASLGQLLYSLYPLFLVLALWLDRQPPSRLTLFRLFLIVPAIYLLTRSDYKQVDLLGIMMMLMASALYALHLPINQRVLYDMPAPTVTLYTLLAMSLVVVPAFLLSDAVIGPVPGLAWTSVMGLTLVTFLSRLTLFLGVKHLGGLQTALLGLGELLITIVVSHIWLGERLSLQQWIGAALLLISIALIAKEKPTRHAAAHGLGWLGWLRPPGLPRDIPWPYD
jgi:drug/metabolite transporter (DMT)-like permease